MSEYPTAWAYEQACRALWAWRSKAFEVQAELATAHRRIEHLTARMRYWRTQATGYPDSRQQREARRKG